MKVFASYNIKGGVGKTATAVNLAYLAARDGYRVLLWDLDPQAAASYLFRIRPRVKGGGKALIEGTRSIDGAIKGTDFDNLDLLPADFTYRNLDLILDSAKKPTRKLRTAAHAAARRVRRDLPRLPAEHLAAVRERAARGRLAARPADPDHAVDPDPRPAHRIHLRLRRAPATASSRSSP